MVTKCAFFFSCKFLVKDLKKQMVYAETLIPESAINSVKFITVSKCQW